MKSRVRAVVLSLMFGLFSKGTVTAQVQARMMLSDTVVCEGTRVTISDMSTDAQGVSWYINDSYKGGADNFEYTPNSSGTYAIRMIAFGAAGSRDTLTRYMRVKANPYFNINFDQGYGNVTLCKGTELTVSQWSSVRGAESVLWKFGDGATSDVLYPRHTYAAAGNYTVEVGVTGFCGYASFNKTVIVTDQSNAKPEINIGVPDLVCPNVDFNVYVSDLSGFGVDSFHLYINDQGPTYLEQFQTSFEEQQIVQFKAIAFNKCGSDTIWAQTVVTDTADQSFFLYAYPDKICPGQSTQIQMSMSTGGYALINFGDGSNDTFTMDHYYTEHTYTDTGLYNVQAYVFSSCGKPDTLQYQVEVSGSSSPSNYGVYMSTNTICPGEYLSFSPPYMVVGDTFYVDFDNGEVLTLIDSSRTISKRYDVTGNYNIQTRLTNRCGNYASYDFVFSVSDAAEIEPRILLNYGNASLPSCVSDTLEFVLDIPGARTVRNINWYFDDGFRASEIKTVRRAFENTGSHFVMCSMRTVCGQRFEVGMHFDITDQMMAPRVNFWVLPASNCVGEMSMVDNFTQNTDSMIIDYGDGTIEELDPMDFHTYHIYKIPDHYLIRLTAVNGCGMDEQVQAYRAVSGPDLEIEFNKTVYSLGDTVKMKAISNSYRNLEWELPDGSGAEESTINFVAENEGTFVVRLAAMSIFGCETMIEREFSVGNIGLNQYRAESGLKIYPNPTNGLIDININSGVGLLKVQIFDSKGSNLFTTDEISDPLRQRQSIDLRSLKIRPNVYFVRVETTVGTEVRRILFK